MHKFLLGILLLPAFAFAEPVIVEKPLVCDKATTVLLTLSTEYKEEPIWFGKTEEFIVVMLLNKKTKTWSLVQYNSIIACVLETGKGYDTNVESINRKNN